MVNDIFSVHGLLVVASLGHFQVVSHDRCDYYEVPDAVKIKRGTLATG